MYVLGCEKCSVDVLVWVFLQLVLITLHFITGMDSLHLAPDHLIILPICIYIYSKGWMRVLARLWSISEEVSVSGVLLGFVA